MTTADTTALLAQLRTVLDLTHTEIQIAETRTAQARTEAVRRELTQNAANGRERADAIEQTIRELGGIPDVIGPFLGRAAALVKALTEQAEPFEEALLGDLALEGQLLDRARYLKALAVAAGEPEVERLAERLVTAHTATVNWLTTVLAEDALGGPAALRRTPFQAVTGVAVRAANLPALWSTRALDRAIDLIRNIRPALDEALDRGRQATELGARVLTGSRDAALAAAEDITRTSGAAQAADALHNLRDAAGALDPSELPVGEYDELTQANAIAAIKGLTHPADLRTIVAWEEAHKNRERVLAAAQAQLAAIAQEVVGTLN